MPLLDRPKSCWIVGAAIETMVWSMKVIATVKIIAARIRLLDRPPVVLLTLIVFSQLWPRYSGNSVWDLAGRPSSVK